MLEGLHFYVHVNIITSVYTWILLQWCTHRYHYNGVYMDLVSTATMLHSIVSTHNMLHEIQILGRLQICYMLKISLGSTKLKITSHNNELHHKILASKSH